ncbi:glutathione S-transferase [Phanerochaete sordida]|uniref:glutathione transferase n=1 Tax=Phanerochaete sordida TaxID=48140 RepID=A0A9P3G9V2_9APHY|nr:glutathione S-transferase [Phanerochaete sordida]
MSHGKQFTLYMHKVSPHGWKIVFVLAELGLTYEPKYIDTAKDEHKTAEFIKLNPNGRTPVLVDHANSDFVVWESNAMLQYIVDKYDSARTISIAPGTDEYYTQLQWLYFQGSGQGPYYGQAGWFTFYHHEKILSVIERYRNEVRRVLGVLESVLSTQKWLVGDKMTAADISFVSWNAVAIEHFVDPGFNFEREFPAAARWHSKMLSRPGIKSAWDQRLQFFAEL